MAEVLYDHIRDVKHVVIAHEPRDDQDPNDYSQYPVLKCGFDLEAKDEYAPARFINWCSTDADEPDHEYCDESHDLVLCKECFA